MKNNIEESYNSITLAKMSEIKPETVL